MKTDKDEVQLVELIDDALAGRDPIASRNFVQLSRRAVTWSRAVKMENLKLWLDDALNVLVLGWQLNRLKKRKDINQDFKFNACLDIARMVMRQAQLEIGRQRGGDKAAISCPRLAVALEEIGFALPDSDLKEKRRLGLLLDRASKLLEMLSSGKMRQLLQAEENLSRREPRLSLVEG